MADIPLSHEHSGLHQHSSDSTEKIPLRYLFTVDGEESQETLQIACDLATAAGAELFLGAPIAVPEQTPLGADELQVKGKRLVAKHAKNAKSQCGNELPEVNEVTRVGHRRSEIVTGMVNSLGITTLIEETVPESGLRTIFDDAFDEQGVDETCDVITVTQITHLESVDSILVPIAAGPHSGFAIDIAVSLARQNDATVELLHFEEKSAPMDERMGKQVLAKGLNRTGEFEPVTQTLLEADSVAERIVDYSANFDVTVMGAPREGLLKQFVNGTIPSVVSTKAEGTVLTAHRAGLKSSWLDYWI